MITVRMALVMTIVLMIMTMKEERSELEESEDCYLKARGEDK